MGYADRRLPVGLVKERLPRGDVAARRVSRRIDAVLDCNDLTRHHPVLCASREVQRAGKMDSPPATRLSSSQSAPSLICAKASESGVTAAERTPPKSRVYPESLASSPAIFDANSATKEDRSLSALEDSPGECLRRARDRLKELRRGLKHTMSAPTLSVPP